MARKAVCTITIPGEMLERVDALAIAQGVPRSTIIVNCVRDLLDEQELATRLLGNPGVREGFFRIFQNRDILRAFASEVIGAAGQGQLELFAKSITRKLDEQAAAGAARPQGTPGPRRPGKGNSRGKR